MCYISVKELKLLCFVAASGQSINFEYLHSAVHSLENKHWVSPLDHSGGNNFNPKTTRQLDWRHGYLSLHIEGKNRSIKLELLIIDEVKDRDGEFDAKLNTLHTTMIHESVCALEHENFFGV